MPLIVQREQSNTICFVVSALNAPHGDGSIAVLYSALTSHSTLYDGRFRLVTNESVSVSTDHRALL